jgi:hypothetical protein
MDYAEAVAQFETEVDRAVNRAQDNGLTIDEIVKELGNIAQGWKDSQ